MFDVKIGKIDKDGYIDIYAYIYIYIERELNFRKTIHELVCMSSSVR